MRIRVEFSKKNEMRYTSHLDLHRAWERTFRRAGLPIIYSQGYNPRPKINLASALPLGFTSDAEVMDAFLEREIPVPVIRAEIQSALPPGIDLHGLDQVSSKEPPLQATLIASEYVITFLDPVQDLDDALARIMGAEQLIRQRRNKQYDLRPLIEETRILEGDEAGLQRIWVRLCAKEGATGRPDELVSALGYDPLSARIHRTRLIFADQQ